jgi:hydroxymethylpyrimidine/phosphomethylpyrimidine kinase
MKIPRALTIAGSDSGGGAGVQADLKTFTALGVYGMSAVTSITVQNTVGVFGVVDVPPEVVYNQIKVVVEDIGVDAVKTGMLSHADIVEAVARAVKDFKLENLVVDPVMRAKSGDPLLKSSDEVALKELLIPLATVVTPNIPEACTLVGKDIKTLEDMERACKEIYSMDPLRFC